MAQQPLMKDYQTAESKIERQISLPFREALKISLRNITIRFGRAMITAAGTFLGIAFLMSVFTGSMILDAVHRAEAPRLTLAWQRGKSGWS